MFDYKTAVTMDYDFMNSWVRYSKCIILIKIIEHIL